MKMSLCKNRPSILVFFWIQGEVWRVLDRFPSFGNLLNFPCWWVKVYSSGPALVSPIWLATPLVISLCHLVCFDSFCREQDSEIISRASSQQSNTVMKWSSVDLIQVGCLCNSSCRIMQLADSQTGCCGHVLLYSAASFLSIALQKAKLQPDSLRRQTPDQLRL